MWKVPKRGMRVVKNNSPEKRENPSQLNSHREKRNELWRTAIALGIPRSALKKQSNSVIAELIQAIEKAKGKAADNTNTSQEKRIGPNPFETQKN